MKISKKLNPLKHNNLNPHQFKMIIMVARGYSNKQIADKMRKKEQHIKDQLRVIYKRMGVKNRVQLTLVVVKENKWLDKILL